jgi:hypothetical protein
MLVTMDLRKMKATTQNRSVWWHIVKEAKAHPEM